jgi:hypothetical protein
VRPRSAKAQQRSSHTVDATQQPCPYTSNVALARVLAVPCAADIGSRAWVLLCDWYLLPKILLAPFPHHVHF